MFHRAVDLKLKDGTLLEVFFSDGKIKQFDVSSLFLKYPVLEALKDRELFLAGHLSGAYGIIWNDELDLEVETVYENGRDVGTMNPVNMIAADAVRKARAAAEISQKELACRTKIDQADISKIERGVANPSVDTLDRIAKALGGELEISIVFKENGSDATGDSNQ